MASRATSTSSGCGNPVSAIDRANASTDGGRAVLTPPSSQPITFTRVSRAPRVRRYTIRVLAYSGGTGYSGHAPSVASAGVSLPVPVVRLDPDLPLPAYAHEGDAGLDLYARIDVTLAAGGGRQLVPTGIALAIPPGHAGFVLPRSGLALRHGLSVVNAPGLIDAAYRGELKVILLNTDPDHEYVVHRGDRIAQLVVQRFESVVWQVIDSFDTVDGTDRGGGFGHSGR
jgi:dUTP pyrophosphatase